MKIPFLNDFEIPDSLLNEWENTNSQDVRYVEKQAVDYIRKETGFDKPIGALWNGVSLMFHFGYWKELEEEGFFYGS